MGGGGWAGVSPIHRAQESAPEIIRFWEPKKLPPHPNCNSHCCLSSDVVVVGSGSDLETDEISDWSDFSGISLSSAEKVEPVPAMKGMKQYPSPTDHVLVPSKPTNT